MLYHLLKVVLGIMVHGQERPVIMLFIIQCFIRKIFCQFIAYNSSSTFVLRNKIFIYITHIKLNADQTILKVCACASS